MFDLERDYQSARRLDLKTETRRFEALFAADPAAALAAFQEARSRYALACVLAGGGVLTRHGALPTAEKKHYASAFAADGRWDKAAGLWMAIVAEQPGVAVFQYTLAEAFAAAGLTGRARKSAERATKLDPDVPLYANLARRLSWLPQVEREAPSWRRLALLVEGYFAVGAKQVALALLHTLPGDPPPGDPDVDTAIRLVRKGFELGAAKAVKAPYKLVVADSETDEAKTAAIRMASGLGLVKDAARRAAEFTPPLADDGGLAEAAAPARRHLRYHAAEAFAADRQYDPAIRQLGALVTTDRHDFAALTGLQRCIGDAVLADLDMSWAPPRPPRIINLLPFYNERTLFEMRLAEMGDWVDHFVVVEATQTFTGKPKPLNFAAMARGYSDRGDQIIPVAIETFPDWAQTAWARDFFQRDSAVRGLVGQLRPDDIILITDADEIVDRRALEGLWPHLASLRMVTSKHFLNYQATPGTRPANRRSGAICRGEHLARFGSTYIRTGLSAQRKSWDSVPRAGWHFTSMGEADAVVAKLAAYAHQEEGKVDHRNLAYMSDHLAGVRAGAYEPGWSFVEIDDSFPRYVRENRAALGQLILDPR